MNRHIVPKHIKGELVTIQVFAEIIQTPIRTVRDLIDRRVIPVIKVRRWVRIPKQEALEALEKFKRPSVVR